MKAPIRIIMIPTPPFVIPAKAGIQSYFVVMVSLSNHGFRVALYLHGMTRMVIAA